MLDHEVVLIEHAHAHAHEHEHEHYNPGLAHAQKAVADERAVRMAQTAAIAITGSL